MPITASNISARWCRPALTAAALCLSSIVAQAADLAEEPKDPSHPFFVHRLMLQVGATFNQIDSSAAVGQAGGPKGVRFSFEDDLGYDSSQTTWAGLVKWRFSDRWFLEGEYSTISRDHSRTLTHDFQFGRFVFPATVGLQSEYDIGLLRLALGYHFYKSNNAEFGLGMSLYAHDYSVSAAGNATIGGLAAGFQTEKFSTVVPLPTIGVYGSYAFNSRWLVSGRLDWMDLTISHFQAFGYDLRDAGGRIFSADVSTEYRVFENLGIGIGYRYQDVSVGATSGGLRGDLSYKTSAPTAFVRTSF